LRAIKENVTLFKVPSLLQYHAVHSHNMARSNIA